MAASAAGPGCEDDDAGGLAGSVGKNHGAANHLVSLAGVDTQLEGDLDRAVEVRRTGLFRENDRFGGGVELALFDFRSGSAVSL